MAAGPMSLLAVSFQTALHMSWHSVLLRGTVGLKHGRYQGGNHMYFIHECSFQCIVTYQEILILFLRFLRKQGIFEGFFLPALVFVHTFCFSEYTEPVLF